MVKKVVIDLDLKDKKVLVCVDFNVLMKDGKIINDNCIVVVFLIIEYILE